MICKKCGKENKDNAKYCGNCGTKLKRKNNVKKYIVIGGIMAAALFLNNEVMKKLAPILYGRSLQSETVGDKLETEEYKLNETFEIGNLTFNFTKTFTSSNNYALWETSSKDKVLAGFEGSVQNNSSSSVDLNDLNVTIYYIDGKGNRQQTDEPKTEFYNPTSSGDWFSSTTVIGGGQSGVVYMFLSPDKGYHTLEMHIEDPMSGEKVTVKNTFYCEGSYENEDASSFIRAAKGFSEDLACVQFYMNETEYFGYIDKAGKIQFYFPAKYEDEICDFPTDFDNGYIQYEYGDMLYTMDKNGNICSKYDGKCVSYGAGYTWIETDESGFDDTEYKYTLYDSNGDVETEATADEDVNIKYLGNSTFLFEHGDGEVTRKYYFANIHKWAESYGEDSMIRSENRLYDGCYTDYEQERKYFVLYNSEGEREEVDLPDDLYDEWIYVCDVSDKYIFFLADADTIGTERKLYIYDLETTEFRNYSGKYADRVLKKTEGEYILNDSLIISMQGEDEENYIGLISAENMVEIGEPIRADDMQISSDIFSVWISSTYAEQQIYNEEGTLLYTYAENDSTGWIGGFSENAMVAGYEKNSIDEDGYEEETEYDDDEIGNKTGHKYNIFMNYQGNSLFDSINYVSGKEIEL